MSTSHEQTAGHERYGGEGRYWDDHEDYHLPDAEFKAASLWSFLQGCGLPSTAGHENDEGVKVCDVGCGAGAVLAGFTDRISAARRVSSACGYDVSPRALGVARELHPHLEFEAGSAHEVAPGWDLLISCDVFEHVDGPFAFLRGLLGKSAHYVFLIPLDLCSETVLRQDRLALAFSHTGHIHQYCKTTALETLRHAGFEILRWQYVDVWQHRTSQGRISLKTRVLRWPERLLYRVCPDLKVALFGGAKLVVLASDRAPHADQAKV